MKTSSKKNDGVYFVWFVVGVFVILFSFAIYNSITRGRFNPYLENYLLEYGMIGDEKAEFTTVPSPVHAIVVSPKDPEPYQPNDPISYSIDLLNNKLPAVIRAKKPEDINVIVLVVESNVTVGIYNNGQPAYRKKLEVFIIDARTNAIFSRNEFLGGDPPNSKASSGPGYGSMPNSSAIKWIKQVLGAR